MLRSVQPVRLYALLATSGAYETGNGQGTTSPVDCRGADQLVLYVTIRREDVNTTAFTFRVDFSAGGDAPYADTGGTTVARMELTLTGAELPAAGASARYAIALPVHGRFALVAAKATFTGKQPSVAIVGSTQATAGDEGRILGLAHVRTGLIAAAASITGDGIGGENPVAVSGANTVELLLYATGTELEVYAEASLDGYDYYRTTWYDPTVFGAVTVYAFKLYMPATALSNIAIRLAAFGAWQRFTFTAIDEAAEVACKAIVGRV